MGRLGGAALKMASASFRRGALLGALTLLLAPSVAMAEMVIPRWTRQGDYACYDFAGARQLLLIDAEVQKCRAAAGLGLATEKALAAALDEIAARKVHEENLVAKTVALETALAAQKTIMTASLATAAAATVAAALIWLVK